MAQRTTSSASRCMPRSERLDSPFSINISPGRRVTLPHRLAVRLPPLPGELADVEPPQGRVRRAVRGGRLLCRARARSSSANVTFRILPGVFVYTAAELNKITLPQAVVHHAALPRRPRAAVHAVPDLGEQRPVRHGERRRRMAVAIPMDCQARQRHLRRLHAQLARQSAARAVRHAGSPALDEGALHLSFLGRGFVGPDRAIRTTCRSLRI